LRRHPWPAEREKKEDDAAMTLANKHTYVDDPLDVSVNRASKPSTTIDGIPASFWYKSVFSSLPFDVARKASIAEMQYSIFLEATQCSRNAF
jgi:hypothetical protein